MSTTVNDGLLREVLDKIAPTALALAIAAYPFLATALVNALVS